MKLRRRVAELEREVAELRKRLDDGPTITYSVTCGDPDEIAREVQRRVVYASGGMVR